MWSYESKNALVFSSFYCNMICFPANTYTDCLFLSVPRSAQLLSHENVSSMSWLAFKTILRGPTLSEEDRLLCMRDESVTFVAKHRILSQASNVAFSSPVSVIYAWNAWDHDPPFGAENVYIFWLELSYGSPSKNGFHKYLWTLVSTSMCRNVPRSPCKDDHRHLGLERIPY